MKRLVSPSLWLFLIVVLVYMANGRTIGAGDTLPARYLPFSVLRAHDVDLDEFPFLYGEDALRRYPVLDGVPYFLRARDGHYLSAYSPGPAILALPLFAPAVWAGLMADSPWAERLEKLAAAVITALSVTFVFLAAGVVVSRGWALAIALVYAFGTSSWSVSSQALWQHGPSQLCVAVLLYCLAKGLADERFYAVAGLVVTAAIVMRPTDLLLVLPVAAWILYAQRRVALRFILFALGPAALLGLYNLIAFGAVTGATGPTTTPTWALFAQVPLREGFLGLLVSPSRGLFVYSPVLLFSLWGFVHVWRHGPATFRPLTIGVTLVVLVVGKWFLWWGGHSWGPRLLADTTPVLCFFLYPLTERLDRSRLLKALFILCAMVSIGIHGLGAFAYDGRWDGMANPGRRAAVLWSWRNGPIAFYGREAVALLPRVAIRGGHTGPTSADSPTLLAASYAVKPVPSEVFVAESFEVSVLARNTGGAVWLADAPSDHGTVRLGWRWFRGDAEAPGGRAPLRFDVPPGRAARLVARIPSPSTPGDYSLTIDLVSEGVVWFGGHDRPAVSAKVIVSPRDPARFVSQPTAVDTPSPAIRVTTDRASYRRGESLQLRVELVNPHRPRSFDAYLILRGPDGAAWFYDGHRPPESGSWRPWVKELPLPARATGTFSVPLSTQPDGDYRWHVVVTEAGTYRASATAAAGFAIGER